MSDRESNASTVLDEESDCNMDIGPLYPPSGKFPYLSQKRNIMMLTRVVTYFVLGVPRFHYLAVGKLTVAIWATFRKKCEEGVYNFRYFESSNFPNGMFNVDGGFRAPYFEPRAQARRKPVSQNNDLGRGS